MTDKPAIIKDELVFIKTGEVVQFKSLAEVFEAQEKFMKLVGINLDVDEQPNISDYAYSQGKKLTEVTQQMLACMSNEIEEVRGQLPWKHWKKYSIEEFRDLVEDTDTQIEVQYELIDLAHFLFELMILWGMDAEDFLRMYSNKMTVNLRRQRNGY